MYRYNLLVILCWQRVASFFFFLCPNADYVLVRRVVGCAIVILVPMSVAHHVMLGFTLLPRTFAEYACCRFVEIR